ncbi:hypothetical protein EF384_05350 [Aerococcus agrisoli]|uniref:YdhG-like domain-containing protein n=1 Tax=Aerococcus agrisoli TaxID=2487350 RepID=A0A3N4GIW4_9LACT|nr:DUF1801 domain-containing protein [Aerococcus agrisoli]RPA60506.1 hypothetical protein EF384_05350 [Aerococcus agrisoli]
MEFIPEIDAYIEAQDEVAQAALHELRRRLAEALPTCYEKISYGMPTIADKKVVFHYSAAKKHLGIYPFPETIDHFINQVGQYRTGKGTLAFPYGTEIPYELLITLAQYNYQNQA